MHWPRIQACVCVLARNILIRLETEKNVISKEIRSVGEKQRFKGSFRQKVWVEKISPGDAGRCPVGPTGNLWAVSAVIQGPQRSWTRRRQRSTPTRRSLSCRHPARSRGTGRRRPKKPGDAHSKERGELSTLLLELLFHFQIYTQPHSNRKLPVPLLKLLSKLPRELFSSAFLSQKNLPSFHGDLWSINETGKAD